MIAIPRWIWLVGGGAVLTLLLLWRVNAEIDRAEERGRQQAYDEVRAASQVVADSWRARVETAETARVVAEAKADAATEAANRETRSFYAANPSAAAVQCLGPERVRKARQARAAIFSITPSGNGAAVPVAGPTDTPDR